MPEYFYAVAEGREVGIYSTWEECEKQVKKFSGAVYKKFKSRREAEVYLLKEMYKDNIIENQPEYFYAVAVGRQPGVYTTWKECEKEVKGVSEARYKKFKSFQLAEQFLRDNGPIEVNDEVTTLEPPLKKSRNEV